MRALIIKKIQLINMCEQIYISILLKAEAIYEPNDVL